jgi:hypothetical protein
MFNGALEELAGLTGEDLLFMNLANPRDDRNLIIMGHVYGYPPMTAVACINGTQS